MKRMTFISDSFTRVFQSHKVVLIFLFIIFVVTEIIINPIGNFPLNDDWVYGKVLDTLINHHFIDTRIWGGASMLTHIFYGKLWTGIFGFSYTVLRFSTLFIAFFGIVFFYFLLSDFVVIQKQQALIGTLMVCFNPLFLSLANSYMTDVPFVCFVIIGLYFYLKYVEKNNLLFLIISIVIFLWIICTRQLSLAMVFGIYLIRVWQTKRTFGSHGILFIISIIGLFLFEYWLRHQKQSYISAGYSYLFFNAGDTGNASYWVEFFSNFSKRWIHFLIFSGFALFPFLMVYLYDFVRRDINKKNVLILSIPFFVAVLIAIRKFPLGNYLYNTGFGPDLLFNTARDYSTIEFAFIKALSILGSITLVFIGINAIIKHKMKLFVVVKKETLSGSIIISFIFYYIFICFSNALFDRYFLIITILTVPVLLKVFPAIFNYKILFGICFTFQMLYSVLSTKDYLQANRIKWEAVDYAKTVLKVHDTDINTGYEFDDFNRGVVNMKLDRWFNEPPNKIIISHQKIPGYRVAKEFYFQRFLPVKTDTVFVLEK